MGMGKSLYDAFPEVRSFFDAPAEVIGTDLKAILFEGPEAELTKTLNTQPAVFLMDVACATLLRARGVTPVAAAGHSLGEYAACVVAGALTFADGLRLTRLRGELMHAAGVERPGTMAAVMGLPLEEISSVCRKVSETGGHGRVVLANVNSSAQLVVSGDVAAVEAAGVALKEAGARRFIPLPVSGAFHSPLMAVVQPEFSEFLEPIRMNDPACPVVTNITAGPVAQAPRLREGFVEQLVSPVRWEESMRRLLADGCDGFYEVGPGRVLRGLLRRIERKVSCQSISV